MTLVHRFQWLRGTLMKHWVLKWAPRTKRFNSLRSLLQHELTDLDSDSWAQYSFHGVVYARVHCGSHLFYVGSSTLSLHEREQSRVRKYRQLQNDRIAFYEPALRWWKATGTFYQYIVIPVALRERDVQACELNLQTHFQPKLNWPWISPLLRQVGLRVPNYVLNMTHSGVIGRQLTRRCSRLWRQRLSEGRLFHLRSQEDVLQLLHELGSEGVAKFNTARLLRSRAAPLPFLYFLVKMSQHMGEPWRTRAVNQLRLILVFRGGALPVSNKILRLLPARPSFILKAKDWVQTFCQHHRALFRHQCIFRLGQYVKFAVRALGHCCSTSKNFCGTGSRTLHFGARSLGRAFPRLLDTFAPLVEICGRMNPFLGPI